MQPQSVNLFKPVLGNKYEKYQRRDQASFAERPISNILDETDPGNDFDIVN